MSHLNILFKGAFVWGQKREKHNYKFEIWNNSFEIVSMDKIEYTLFNEMSMFGYFSTMPAKDTWEIGHGTNWILGKTVVKMWLLKTWREKAALY